MNVVLDDAQRFLDTRIACGAVAFTLLVRLALEAADRVIRRKARIALAPATRPYSGSITQPGSGPHGRPPVRKCHIK